MTQQTNTEETNTEDRAPLGPAEVLALIETHFPGSRSQIGPMDILSCGRGNAVV